MASPTGLVFVTRTRPGGRWPIASERTPALGKGLGALLPRGPFLCLGLFASRGRSR